MSRRLQLVKSELQDVSFQWLGAFRLRIEASDSEGTGADPNVFLYQRNLANPYDGSVVDVWLGIASPVDMSEYPVGEPNNETAYPFYRINWMEVDLRAIEFTSKVYLGVVAEVDNLLKKLDRMEQLVPTATVMVGFPNPGGGGSASSSTSVGGGSASASTSE